MATSGSVDFLIPAKKIIAASLRICGALKHGQEPSENHMESARFASNLIIKELAAKGRGGIFWKLTTASFTAVAGQADYTSADSIPTDANQIKAVRYIDSSTDHVDLKIIGTKHYEQFRDKTDTGVPEFCYPKLGRLPSSLSLSFYPAPQSAVSIEVDYWQEIDDVDTNFNDIDIPTSWGAFFKWELANHLSEEFDNVPADKIQRLQARAELAFREVVGKSKQHTDNVTPHGKRYY